MFPCDALQEEQGDSALWLHAVCWRNSRGCSWEPLRGGYSQASCSHSTLKWSAFISSFCLAFLSLKTKKSKTKTPPASTPPPPPTKQNKNKQEVSFLLLLSCYQQTEKEIGGHQAFGKQSELTQLHSRLTPPTFLKFTKNQLGHAWFMLVLFQKVLFHTNSSR